MDNETAGVASMRAHAQRLWDIRVASAAFLRTAAWIHRDKLAPGPFCLGCKDRSELCPRDVADLFGQHAAGEAFDVEIFDCDGLVFLHQASGHLVEKVRARVPHVSVLTSEDSDGFTSTAGPAFSTRHPPLGTGDFSLRPLQQSWILDTRTVGSSSEGLMPTSTPIWLVVAGSGFAGTSSQDRQAYQ